MICNSEMEYYFSKEYTQEPYRTMMEDIGKVDYYKCVHCGFVFSKTHYELSKERWEKLNFDCHHFLEADFVNNYDSGMLVMRQPPFLHQAAMIKIFKENNLIDATNMLDFAGGYGRLSKILKKYYSINLPVYDPYVQTEENDIKYVVPDSSMKYSVVINSACFEHIRDRTDIDNVNNIVADDGCLIIHTIVCERVPNDPNWFYLAVPVHCAFHTNKSMEILMKQWNYVSSVYSPKREGGHCWVLFKKEPENICEKIALINNELQETYFHYKQGFVDYWKGF